MALMQKGSEMTVEQVVSEALRDRVFFENSGGGVTLSGGEPLYQFGLALALLKELKHKHIHTVIETTGNVPWQSLEETLPYTDAIYYDVKHVDSSAHRQFVGAGTELILGNLEKLVHTDPEITVRIPVIPGFNDDAQSIAMIAERLRCMGVGGVELLKFHQYGAGKYASLDQDYKFKCVSVLEDAAFEKVKAQYRLAGLKLISY
jgi:pyruvate formate lyase activating enzyme